MPQPNGSAIQQRREEKGIRRSALAATVGLSYQHLYNIENGYKGSAIETLWRIAKALDMEIGDVVAPRPQRDGEVTEDDDSRWSA